MAKGISISMAADTRSFITGVQKGVINPLDDAAEILEDLGRDGSRDFDKLEGSMRDAQRETDDTRKKFSDLQKEIRETGRKSRTDFAKPVGDSADRVKKDLDEVRNEAKQNAAEMFSSFDGSFESIADAAQGTLGGLSAGLGGIPGIAAVAAGAAGLGLLTARFTEQQELAEELKTALVDAYKSAAAEGKNFIDQAAIDMAALDIFADTPRRVEAEEAANRIGVAVSTYVRAQAGDVEALNDVIDAAARKREELVDAYGDQRSGPALDAERAAVTKIISANERLLETHREVQAGIEGYQTYVDENEQNQRDQIKRTRAVDQERWEERERNLKEAAAAPPLRLRSEIQEPDTDSLRRGIEDDFSRRPARVQARVFTRNGTEVF